MPAAPSSSSPCFSEGALLFVAAQAGFVDGPRVMANMAVDSWLPHRFSALSERLTMRNGILIMGGTALAALALHRAAGLEAGRHVRDQRLRHLLAVEHRDDGVLVRARREARSRLGPAPAGARRLRPRSVCLILVVTVIQKFLEGGWLTLLITAGLIAICFAVRRHYRLVGAALGALDAEIPTPAARPDLYPRRADGARRELDPGRPIAALLVGGYGGLGRQALLTLLRMFPGHFEGVVFVSVAVVDSDVFKGAEEVPALETRTRRSLEEYERFATALGLPATSVYAVGTEVAIEAEQLAVGLVQWYPKAMVVAGQIIFAEDTVWNRVLHNQTALLDPAAPAAARRPDDRAAGGGRPLPPPGAAVAGALLGARLLAEVMRRSQPDAERAVPFTRS